MHMLLFPEQKDALPPLDHTQVNMSAQGLTLPPVCIVANQCIGPTPVDRSKMQHIFR